MKAMRRPHITILFKINIYIYIYFPDLIPAPPLPLLFLFQALLFWELCQFVSDKKFRIFFSNLLRCILTCLFVWFPLFLLV